MALKQQNIEKSFFVRFFVAAMPRNMFFRTQLAELHRMTTLLSMFAQVKRVFWLFLGAPPKFRGQFKSSDFVDFSGKFRAIGSVQFRGRAFFAQLRADFVHLAPYKFGGPFFITSGQFVIKRGRYIVKIWPRKFETVEVS
jgi:hypothetical protein